MSVRNLPFFPSQPFGQPRSLPFVVFSGIGDGNIANANYNAAVLQSILNAGRAAYIPFTSFGYHFGANQITVPQGCAIVGESQVQLLSTAPGTSLFRMTGQTVLLPSQSAIDNVHIDMTGAQKSATVTFLAQSPGVVNWTAHGLSANAAVYFTNTGGGLPPELTANTVYYVQNPTANTFNVSAIYGGSTINFSGAGSGTNTGFYAPTAIRYGTGAGNITGGQLSRLLFTNCWESIGDEASAANAVNFIKWYDIRTVLNLGRSLYLRRSNGELWFESIVVDRLNDPVNGAYEGARFENVKGIELNRFDVIGGNLNPFQSTAVGLVINGGFNAYLNRVLIDSTSGNGILLNNLNRCSANWIETFGNLGYQISLTGCNFCTITNVRTRGASDISGHAASDGFSMSGCTNNTIASVVSVNNTGNGVTIANTSTDNSISDINSTANTGFGIAETTSSDRNIIANAGLANNTAGAVTLVGANSRLVNYIAGTYQLITGGAIPNLPLANGNQGAPVINLASAPATGIYFPAGGFVSLDGAGGLIAGVDGAARFLVYSNAPLNFDPGAGSGDTGFFRGAPGVIGLTNGVAGNGGTFRAVNNTPATLASGATANYSLGALTSYFQRITANAANSTLSGLTTTAGQVDGMVLCIINVAAAGTLTISHLDAGSSAANQFLCSGGASFTLNPNQSCDLIYDGTVTKWRAFKRN